MNTLQKTDAFADWFRALKDPIGKARIAARLTAAQHGHFGDNKAVGGGVREMRVDVGPGYRVYYARRETTIYILLLGGDKSSQTSDITTAKRLWNAIRGRLHDNGDTA